MTDALEIRLKQLLEENSVFTESDNPYDLLTEAYKKALNKKEIEEKHLGEIIRFSSLWIIIQKATIENKPLSECYSQFIQKDIKRWKNQQAKNSNTANKFYAIDHWIFHFSGYSKSQLQSQAHQCAQELTKARVCLNVNSSVSAAIEKSPNKFIKEKSFIENLRKESKQRLFKAIICRDLKAIERELRTCSDNLLEKNFGDNILQVAAASGDADVFALILMALENKQGLDDSRWETLFTPLNEDSPLHIAAESHADDIVGLILSHPKFSSKTINTLNQSHQTALQIAAKARVSLLDQKNLQKNAAIVKLLLANGADATLEDSEGNTALHLAARTGKSNTKAILDNSGSEIEPVIVQLIKADPNKQTLQASNKLGNTPLHMAFIRQLNVITANHLLEAGADLYVENNEKKFPLSYAVKALSNSQFTQNLIATIGDDAACPAQYIGLEVTASLTDVVHVASVNAWLGPSAMTISLLSALGIFGASAWQTTRFDKNSVAQENLMLGFAIKQIEIQKQKIVINDEQALKEIRDRYFQDENNPSEIKSFEQKLRNKIQKNAKVDNSNDICETATNIIKKIDEDLELLNNNIKAIEATLQLIEKLNKNQPFDLEAWEGLDPTINNTLLRQLQSPEYITRWQDKAWSFTKAVGVAVCFSSAGFETAAALSALHVPGMMAGTLLIFSALIGGISAGINEYQRDLFLKALIYLQNHGLKLQGNDLITIQENLRNQKEKISNLKNQINSFRFECKIKIKYYNPWQEDISETIYNNLEPDTPHEIQVNTTASTTTITQPEDKTLPTNLEIFNELPEPEKEKLLHYACADNDLQFVEWILSNEKYKNLCLNHPNAYGQTPLHIAAKKSVFSKRNLRFGRKEQENYRNNAKIIGLLLAHGADFTWQDKRGNTALHLAARAGLKSETNNSVVKQLIAADTTKKTIHTKNCNGQTPLLLAFSKRFNPSTAVELIKAGAKIFDDKENDQDNHLQNLATTALGASDHIEDTINALGESACPAQVTGANAVTASSGFFTTMRELYWLGPVCAIVGIASLFGIFSYAHWKSSRMSKDKTNQQNLMLSLYIKQLEAELSLSISRSELEKIRRKHFNKADKNSVGEPKGFEQQIEHAKAKQPPEKIQNLAKKLAETINQDIQQLKQHKNNIETYLSTVSKINQGKQYDVSQWQGLDPYTTHQTTLEQQGEHYVLSREEKLWAIAKSIAKGACFGGALLAAAQAFHAIPFAGTAIAIGFSCVAIVAGAVVAINEYHKETEQIADKYRKNHRVKLEINKLLDEKKQKQLSLQKEIDTLTKKLEDSKQKLQGISKNSELIEPKKIDTSIMKTQKPKSKPQKISNTSKVDETKHSYTEKTRTAIISIPCSPSLFKSHPPDQSLATPSKTQTIVYVN